MLQTASLGITLNGRRLFHPLILSSNTFRWALCPVVFVCLCAQRHVCFCRCRTLMLQGTLTGRTFLSPTIVKEQQLTVLLSLLFPCHRVIRFLVSSLLAHVQMSYRVFLQDSHSANAAEECIDWHDWQDIVSRCSDSFLCNCFVFKML